MANLSYRIIGMAMEVHSALGPGLDEVFYHELLSEKLRAAGIEHEFKPRGHLMHRGAVADTFEPDLVFPNELVAELKVSKEGFVPENLAQLFSYLKFRKLTQGLLLNFGRQSLEERFHTFNPPPPTPLKVEQLVASATPYVPESSLLGEVCAAILRVYHEFGLGYCDTTYRGLLPIEFNSIGLSCSTNPVGSVRYAGRLLGETRFNCLVVSQTCAVEVTALRDHIYAPDRAVLQTALRHLDLPWGVIVNFGKSSLEFNGVTRPGKSV